MIQMTKNPNHKKYKSSKITNNSEIQIIQKSKSFKNTSIKKYKSSKNAKHPKMQIKKKNKKKKIIRKIQVIQSSKNTAVYNLLNSKVNYIILVIKDTIFLQTYESQLLN